MKTKGAKKHRFCVQLEIRGYDAEGKLTGVRRKKTDIILDNFGIILAGVIQEWSGTKTVVVIDTGGASRTLWLLGASVNIWFPYTTGAGRGARVHIGSGTTTPARSDYALVTKEGEAVSSAASYAAGTITFSASITLAVQKTITEAGFVWRGLDSGGTLRDVMQFRDTFAGVTGTQFTVQYSITL